jgi:hypothetical protein
MTTEETEGWQGPLCTSVLVLRDRFRRVRQVYERFTSRVPYTEATHQHRKMTKRLEAEFDAAFLGALLTTAAAVESLINFYLAMRMQPTEFTKVERKERTLDKWTTVLKKLIPTYIIPDDLRRNTSDLFDARNNLMHGKTRITRDGVVVQAGSVKQTPFDDLEKWTKLPWQLIENLAQFDSRAQFDFNQHVPGWRP